MTQLRQSSIYIPDQQNTLPTAGRAMGSSMARPRLTRDVKRHVKMLTVVIYAELELAVQLRVPPSIYYIISRCDGYPDLRILPV